MADQTGSSLADLQQWMQDALMFPGLVDQQRLHAYIADTDQLSASSALAIYQRSYYARLLSCMREQFPALCYAVGESVFNQFAIEYLRECPSDSYTLYELGRRFPGYLNGTRPDKDERPHQKERWIEFMCQLSHFERLAFTLFDADGDEAKIINNEHMPDEKLVLQQCFALHQAQFPVAQFYCAVRDNKQPTLPPYQISYVALVRNDFKTQLILLNREQHHFLTNLNRLLDVEMTINKTAKDISIARNSDPNEAKENLFTFWSKPDGWKSSWVKQGLFKMKH